MRKLIALLFLVGMASAQAVLSPMPRQCFNDTLSAGKPLVGGKIYTYQAGTSVQQATFTDSTGLTQNTNPVVLDVAGCASIWLTSGQSYRFVAQNSTGVQEWVTDNVSGLATTSSSFTQAVTSVTFSSTPTFTSTAQYQAFKMTLTGNVTSSTLLMNGINVPSLVTFELTQDGAGNRTFSWPLNTWGGATPNYAANAVTTQTFFWDGTTAYAVNSKIFLPNSGNFSNTQMNQYLSSLVNGIPADMYRSIQGFPGYTTEAGTFGIAVPASAPIGEADAMVGMVTSACNSASRTTCNAVAVSGHAQAQANGAGVWGQNTTVSNDVGTTATNLVGNEIDLGINGDQSGGYVHGLDIFLSPAPGSTMPTNVGGTALEIGNSNSNGQWSQGIYILGRSIQPSGNAFYVDSVCVTGPCSSASITLTGVNASSVAKFGTMKVDANGNTAFTSTGTGVGITYPGSTFANLSAAPNGTVLYCTDCKNVADNSAVAGAACVSGGQGAMARRQNSRWDCN